jgi:hypothetical protein
MTLTSELLTPDRQTITVPRTVPPDRPVPFARNVLFRFGPLKPLPVGQRLTSPTHQPAGGLMAQAQTCEPMVTISVSPHPPLDQLGALLLVQASGPLVPPGGGDLGQSSEQVTLVTVVRDLVEQERVAEARQMLESTPASILDDPAIRRLRRLLAPPAIRATSVRDGGREREYAWLRENGKRYRGNWVAITETGLVAAAPTLKQLREQLRAHNLPRAPLLHKL